MKIQLDTKAKTIKIDEIVSFKELMTLVKKLLPNNEWQKYSIDATPMVNWSNPIIIDRVVPYNQPWITFETPVITTGTNTRTMGYEIPEQTFNFQTN